MDDYGNIPELTSEEETAWSAWIKEHPGDYRRAASSLGIREVPYPTDDVGNEISAPPDSRWDSVHGGWVSKPEGGWSVVPSGGDPGGEDRETRRAAIIAAYQELLGREPESDEVIEAWLDSPGTIDEIRAEMRDSEEGKQYVNPFGSAPGVASATDPGVHAMIERDRAGWLDSLRTHASGFKDSGAGSNWEEVAQDELNAAIRQMRYADNAGTDPKRWLDEAMARIGTRLSENAPGEDKPPVGEDKPPVGEDTTTSNFAPRPATPYNAGQQQPYSMAPQGQPSMASPQPFMGSMNDVVNPGARQPSGAGMSQPGYANPNGTTPPPQYGPQAANASWNQADYNYAQAGQAYANGPNGAGYSPAPWEQSRDRFSGRPPAFGGPRKVGEAGERWPDREPWGQRRAERFERRNDQDNQRNANLGATGFDQQMDNWLRAYNQWNEKGANTPANYGQGAPRWQ